MTSEFEQFTNLEHKLYQIIELFKANKSQKESLEKDVESYKAKINQLSIENDQLKSQIDGFNKEHKVIKEKVESMLSNLERLQF
ncbi:MAG: hypothetical protein MK025_01890 [Acidobacteriia bacterium]|jgi:cell division protein FtsB|nr:hypothetical protein [Terriglobia bacterium]